MDPQYNLEPTNVLIECLCCCSGNCIGDPMVSLLCRQLPAQQRNHGISNTVSTSVLRFALLLYYCILNLRELC
jgi:hypothetical protein